MINVYKADNGFGYSTFRGLIKDGVEQIPNEIKNDLIQVSEQTFQDLVDHKLMWQNGELVENPNYNTYKQKQDNKQAKIEILKQIQDLKQKLFDTDYQAIKYAEGELSFSEYEPIKNQRKMWRVKINELEKQL